MTLLIYLAVFLLVAASLAHSYLGERYILVRLFRRDNLPRNLGSAEFTKRTLRFAWHLTSAAWLGFAMILLVVAHPPVTSSKLGLIVGCTFLAHSVIALVGSRGRHLSWPVFLAIGIIAIYATRP